MSYRLEFVSSGDGRSFYAESVDSLEQGAEVIKEYDEAFQRWQEAGYPELDYYPVGDRLRHILRSYEGCDVFAVDLETDTMYIYDDEENNGWSLM